LAVSILVAALGGPAVAEHRAPCPANGCGPQSWRVKCIPDRFLGCNFREACDKHDVCYSQCAACGKRHDDNVCRVATERKKLRSVCDGAIERDIARINRGSVLCAGFGWIYKWAVQRFGESSFATRALEAARGPTTEGARAEAIKREMEAIADYAANGGREIDLERLRRIDPAMEALIEADRAFENRFTTRLESGEVKLEFGRPARPARESTRSILRTPEGRSMEKREYLNGIDITHMRVEGQRLDLDSVLQQAPDVAPERLERNFKYQEVR
jgi:hypothetical protein